MARELFLRRNCAPSSEKMGDEIIRNSKFLSEIGFHSWILQILAAALDDTWERLPTVWQSTSPRPPIHVPCARWMPNASWKRARA